MAAVAPSGPQNANWSMPAMKTWLQHLDQKAIDEYEDTAAWICGSPVTFSTGDMKAGWQAYEQAVKERLSIVRATKLSHHKAKTWILFCDTPAQSYVGMKTPEAQEGDAKINQWDLVECHAWAMAIVNTKKSGHRKTIFLFDCDQAIPTTPRELSIKGLRTQRERRFCEELKHVLAIDGVYVGNHGADRADKDECLSEATQWIEELAAKDGVSLEEDPGRFEGFVELTW